MATPYSDIFTRFLRKINDDLYNVLTVEESEDDLIGIMESSFMMVKFPRTDITKRSNTTKEFVYDLPEKLQELISVAMKYEWAGRQIVRIENTRQKFTEGDFKLTSQANHLEKLLLMQDQCDKELSRKTMKRSYSTTSGQANWGGLAGGAQ